MGGAGLATHFALTSLAVWRVTHLLAEEDGPADAVLRLRAHLGERRLGELMDCFYCLSVWVAAPASLVVARRRRELPVAWLALSGAACLLERATGETAHGRRTLEPHQVEIHALPRTLRRGAAAAR
jgi:hypothetical protein